MLVLSRRKGEKLLVGNTVITLIDVGGKRARIGIDAPADVRIRRAELQAKDDGVSEVYDHNPELHSSKAAR